MVLMVGRSPVGMTIGLAVGRTIGVTVLDASDDCRAQIRLQRGQVRCFGQRYSNGRGRSGNRPLLGGLACHPVGSLEADHPVVDLQVLTLDHLSRLSVEDVPLLRRGLPVHQCDESLGKGVEVTHNAMDTLQVRVLMSREQKILLQRTLPC